MPELPEVETVARGLDANLSGRRIAQVTLHRKKLRVDIPKGFAKTLEGKKVLSVGRRAKYVLVRLEGGVVFIIHLGMSGQVRLDHGDPEPQFKHEHITFICDKKLIMRFVDPRRFGLVALSDDKTLEQHALFAHLGVEPFSNTFNAPMLHAALQVRKASIKASLMDQTLVAGLGNIYVCETLFRSRISPLKKSSTITPKQCELLVKHARNVLNEAIESGGSTLRDYVRSSGDGGYFQHHFDVYGRESKPCTVCGTTIERIVQQARSSFYCPQCQT